MSGFPVLPDCPPSPGSTPTLYLPRCHRQEAAFFPITKQKYIIDIFNRKEKKSIHPMTQTITLLYNDIKHGG